MSELSEMNPTYSIFVSFATTVLQAGKHTQCNVIKCNECDQTIPTAKAIPVELLWGGEGVGVKIQMSVK